MARLVIAAIVAVLTLCGSAEARVRYWWPDDWRRHDQRYFHHEDSWSWNYVEPRRVYHRNAKVKRKAKAKRWPPKHLKPVPRGSKIEIRMRKDRSKLRTLGGYAALLNKPKGTSLALAHVVKPLADKVHAIVASCGSRVVSAYRPGARVNGSGRPSLHSHYPAKAVDLVGNPACIRRALRGWPGGMSTDYAAVRHVHISYAPGGREWGARFAHYRPNRRRLASRW